MIQRITLYLQRFITHRRYPYLVAMVGFLDMFLFVVPNDLLMISEAVASPKRWRFSVVIVALGSAAGASALAFVLKEGHSAFLYFVPSTLTPEWWSSSRFYFQKYGAWALFISAAAPVPVQPFVAGAVFSNLELTRLFLVVLAGRLIKYTALANLARIFPKRLQGKSSA